VSFGEIVGWSYVNRRPWRWPVYRALKLWGTNVGRGRWQANPALMKKIRGETDN
jgi:hypothetical protein